MKTQAAFDLLKGADYKRLILLVPANAYLS